MSSEREERKVLLRLCTVFVVTAFAAVLPCDKALAAQDKPNVVLILMDNFGYGELGCYGGEITRGAATPRIDKLASEGFRSTN